MPKKKTIQQRKFSWNNLVVASVDSLPDGVFLLFVTSAKSPNGAAQKKAMSFNIPGNTAVIRQFPLNKTTGKTLFQKLLNSFEAFPYGNSDCLVKATTSAISRKYSKLSSQDPDQIELRNQVIQQQIEERQSLLNGIKEEVSRLTREVAELSANERHLISEIARLEDEKHSLLKWVNYAQGNVSELEKMYGDLKELAEIDGDEQRYDDYEQREYIASGLRTLIERYMEEK